MNHFAISGILTGVSSLFFGLFVYSKGRTKPTNKLWALFAITVSVWGFGASRIAVEQDPRYALLAWRLAYSAGVVWISPLFYHFVCSFLSIQRPKVLLSQYAVATIFLGFIWTKFYFSGVRYTFGQFYYSTPGYLFSYFFLWWSALILLAHYELLKAFKTARGMRRQITVFFLATSIGYSGGSLSYLPIFGIDLYPWGTYAIPVYTVIMTYGILQYRLFDIQVVIRRSLVYSTLVTLLTVGYFGLIYGIERTFQITFGYQSAWLSLIAFALMALTFQPLKIGIQRIVDWLVFRSSQEHLVKKLERLENQALQSEKFKAVSTLAAGMAHEIKNPLTALRTFTEYIPEKKTDPEFLEKLHEVYTAEINRIQDIVGDLLEFSKPRPPELKPVDLGPLIASTVNLLSSDLLRRRIRWTVDCQHNGAAIHADPDQLRQVLINLIQNAADAMPTGGQLKIATQAVNSHIKLTVSDTGHGIPPALLPKIFDPFVTTKPDGNGLGLAMAYSILQVHRGSIHADSEPNRGTTFTVSLPL